MHKYYHSFKVLLEKSLQAEKKDQIVVIYDESLSPYFEGLLEVINDNQLSVTFIHFPISYQEKLVELFKEDQEENLEVPLPHGLIAAIAESTVILNLLAGKLSTTPIRRAIVHQERPKECRLAHIPGISDEVLTITGQSPFEEILTLSEMIAWTLGEAHKAELKTVDKSGKEYSLIIKLDGWETEPLMSPGILFPGSWGNVPPGETFICPNFKNVSGEVCINGSVPGFVLTPDDEIILNFEQGKLVKWDSKPHSAAAQFLESEQKKAIKREDTNWNTFAELGVGLNPSIKTLTGNALFDEKMLGTIHIAIGDNTGFGHDVKADIHADMVSQRPSLVLDGKEIISSGNLNEELIRRWRDNPEIQPLKLSPNDKISMKYSKIEIDNNCIKRRLSRAGRIGFVEILKPELRSLSMKIVKRLPEPVNIEYSELMTQNRNKNELQKMLEVLHHYRVIEILDEE